MKYQGNIIKRERLKNNWSQAGLCKGICTVSYLSKIEKGIAEPSWEILSLLLSRLNLSFDEKLENEANAAVENLYEVLFSGHYRELKDKISDEDIEKYSATSSGIDFLLLRASADPKYELKEVRAEIRDETISDVRQLAILKIIEGRAEEAVLLLPNAYTHFMAGLKYYEDGAYNSALNYLGTAYKLAAENGYAGLMLQARVYSGNCYCNMVDLANMESEYRVAKNIAGELNAFDMIEMLDYNVAASLIEAGRFEEAYTFFSKLNEPNKMSLHKLAVCCEKTGQREEALAAIEKAKETNCDYLDNEITDMMLELVLYRLEHEAYLSEAEYGEMLTECFNRLRKELQPCYALFHIPWMIEWLEANRKYKKALELLKDFPNRAYKSAFSSSFY